jgi:hypothetical protein
MIDGAQKERRPQARAWAASVVVAHVLKDAEHFTCVGAMAVPRVPHMYCKRLSEEGFIETTGLEKSC